MKRWCLLPPQVSDHSSPVAAVGCCGDGVAAAVWFYRGGDGLRLLEDFHGCRSCGSGSGGCDPQHPEPPPGRCQSPGESERVSCSSSDLILGQESDRDGSFPVSVSSCTQISWIRVWVMWFCTSNQQRSTSTCPSQSAAPTASCSSRRTNRCTPPIRTVTDHQCPTIHCTPATRCVQVILNNSLRQELRLSLSGSALQGQFMNYWSPRPIQSSAD